MCTHAGGQKNATRRWRHVDSLHITNLKKTTCQLKQYHLTSALLMANKVWKQADHLYCWILLRTAKYRKRCGMTPGLKKKRMTLCFSHPLACLCLSVSQHNDMSHALSSRNLDSRSKVALHPHKTNSLVKHKQIQNAQRHPLKYHHFIYEGQNSKQCGIRKQTKAGKV